jgi:hypothetical protein
MKTRATNPRRANADRYVLRGITVCDRWRDSFANFLADMGRKPSPQHSLDRVDGSKGYEPWNCRWATPREQSNNLSSNVLVAIDGVTKTAALWSDESGIPADRIRARLRKGWEPRAAVFQPLDPKCARAAKTARPWLWRKRLRERSSCDPGGGL